MLDLHGILTDDEIAEVFDTGHRCAGLALEGGLAPSHQPLVCLYFDKDIGTIRVGRERNAEDFHIGHAQTCVDLFEGVVNGVLPMTGLSKKWIASAWVQLARDGGRFRA